ncbi:hypothetical protein [Nibribacter koreensis]|uniref:hypothetical protein n=1 Tax=Nibribacter koreensis TaxID=1084519 RepID=UPI0031E8FE5B
MMKNKTKSGAYVFLLWGSSIVFIAPIIFIIIGLLNEDFDTGFEVIPLFVLFGLVLSLPALSLSFIIFKFLSKRITSAVLLKSLINLFIIVSIFITFQIIGGTMALMLSLVYSGSVVLASLIYPLGE